MDERKDNFAELLKRCRNGDQDALRQLSEQYEREVRIVARVLLGPALRPYLDSMDLVQSIHRSLMLGLRQEKFEISSPDKLIALTLTMVRRKVARHWRKLQRQQRLETAHEGQNLPDLLISLSSPQDDPARAAQFNDQVRYLCKNLTDTEQRILELRRQGYATAEIAESIGISGVALRVRLTRLKQRLREFGVFDDWI